MKNKRLLIAVILIVVLCMGSSVLLTYNRIKGILQNEYENELRMESGMIASVVDNCFLRPITVAETMSKDVSMSKILNIKNKQEATSVEDEASAYLKSIRDGFGYTMVFAVSDATKAYFTYDSITKYIDPENVEADSWYKSFIEKDSEKTYILDVDTDKINNWALSVFINAEVCDEEGKLLGTCGVGVDMTELQHLLERYERIYDVKIALIDKTGLVQVDVDAVNIENAYIQIDNLDLLNDGECYYEIGEYGSRTITYIDDLEWYLVVQNNNSLQSNVLSVMLPSLACMIVGILVISGIFYMRNRDIT